MNRQDVAALYDRDPEGEWGRLVRDPYHTLELNVYLYHIASHLPAGALVLDAGGGPGRYTIELARRGYEVVLLDISEGELALARAQIALEAPEVQARVRDVVAGDVMDLGAFADRMFDGVLCLDPLTYLPEPDDQHQAVAELARVTKPGGLVAVSVRGYLAVLRTILRADPDALLDGTLEQLQETKNATVRGVRHRFFRAGELRALAESAGLTTVLMAGGEGLSDGLVAATNTLAEDAEKWALWMAVIVETSTEPAVVDGSSHMLWVGRKVEA